MNKVIQKSLLPFLIVLSLIISAADLDYSSYSNLITSRFDAYQRKAIEEKVYLHTDKPYYSAGENIWFKAYLVKAINNAPAAYSKYIYVELINRLDSVVTRVKVKKDSIGTFAGYIKLKPEIASGDYNLRAYTNWMQNSSSDFFFNKNIYIGNRIDNGINCNTTYSLKSDGRVEVKMKFTDDAFKALSAKKFQITPGKVDKIRRKAMVTSTADGTVIYSLPYDTADVKSNFLDINLSDESLKYNSKVYMPDFRKSFDVQFFPESGNLINDGLQMIAFKAIGTDGLAVKVSGKVYTASGEEITDIETLFNGMGRFSLNTSPAEKYYAVLKSDNGIEKIFNLPTSTDRAVVFHMVIARGRIAYEIKSKGYEGKMNMLIHSKGAPVIYMPVNKYEGQIPDSIFDAGISTVTLLDTAGNTLCERLFFKLPTLLPVVKMTADKEANSKRDEVNLNFNVQSLLGLKPTGSFSVSITDNYFVKLDSLNDNIVTNLLLTSDLKGHIEKPASYFTNEKISASQKLDLLMLTQGWRRYNTSDIIKGNNKKPEFYLEMGQTLSGKVLNLFGKPAKKCNIFALADNLYKTAVTDSLGMYVIDGIEFSDSTSIVVKAQKSRKGLTDVEVVPDRDIFPKASSYFPTPQATKNEAPLEYFMQSKNKYYMEGGMKVYNLQEVTVTAEKKQNSSETEFFSGMGDDQLTAKDLERFGGMSLLDAIGSIAGVNVSGDQVSIRGSLGSPTILIDGFQLGDSTDLRTMSTSDVENIEVFKGASAAMFGSQGGNGVIVVTLKKGAAIGSTPQISFAAVMPLGIQKPELFYMPKYDVDSVRIDTKPDLRTTVYWNPSLQTDANGNINVRFFTADESNDYSVVFEGITLNGELCRYVAKLKR